MSLLEKLKKDLRQSLVDGDKVKRKVLSVFVGDIQSDEKRSDFKATDEVIVARLKKSVQASQENYETNGQAYWADEVRILSEYLPKQMTEQELSDAIDSEIQGQDNPNIGSVMGALKQKYAGLFDGKMASKMVKEKL